MNRPWRAALDFLDRRVLEADSAAKLELPPLTTRQRWSEWLFIFLAILFYCFPFLDLNSLNNLRGNESQVFQSLDQLLELGIKQAGHFPLWNPYIYAGIPYAADPMLHAYDPFISIPVLLFGTQAGFKIAVLLAFFIAAFGMWWLARLMRLGPFGRLWVSLLYAFSGATMQRFFQGQYLLQVATGWLPWIIAGVYAATLTRRRLHVVIAALALAMLFLCGNAYYAYYSVYAVGILALVMLVRVSAGPLRLRVDLPGLKALLTIAVLSVALVAAQLLPLLGFWDRIAKQTDRELKGSQTVQQVWLDLTSKDPHRPDAYASLPPEEFYAYVGLAPFVLLVVLPFAWRKGRRRILLYFLLLALFAVLWIDVRQMPWKGLFENVAFLYQFRYPTRMLIFATLALAALSGLAVDLLASRLDALAARFSPKAARVAAAGARYVLAALLLAAIMDVAAAHRQDLSSERYYSAPDTVLGWLKQHDSGLYYIYAPNGWHQAAFANQLRYLNAWYPFNDIRRLEGRINTRDLQAMPKYEILGNDAPAPQGSVLVKRFDQHTIYLHPDALPFAFTVPTTALKQPAGGGAPFAASETSAVNAYAAGTDSVEAIVNGQPGQTLVVLSTLAPGWQLTIDEHAMPVLNVSGYMATGLLAGTHRYEFAYRPAAVPVGWLTSLLALVVALALAATDTSRSWQLAFERLRSTDWRSRLDRMQRWKPLPLPVPQSAAPVESDSLLLHLHYRLASLKRLPAAALARVTWPAALFTAAVGLYLLAVLYRNAAFPIFFFTDEAVHMNQAADLLLHGFRNAQHEFLPTYFYIGTMFSLNSLSVYVQVIPFLLFGKSVAVTRGVSGLITAAGAVAAGLTLRNVFKVRHYWLGVLLLIASPAWFLHARTAFEYAELAAWYSVFIYFYLQYRTGKPGFLLAAVLAGAAMFYTHGLGQVLTGVVGAALFLTDIRFHLRPENRRALLTALAAAVLLAIPYVRYQLAHPEITAAQIAQRGSYLLDHSLSLLQKVGRFAYEYFHGLSPLYWYLPNDYDLVRHVMKGYGHIWIATLPFALLGLYFAIRNIRDAKHRVLIVALLAAPVPASLVAVGIIRELWLMVPIALLTALGIVRAIDWQESRQRLVARLAPALVFVVLSGYSLHMLRDALVNGPGWYQDYSLYGMQYGGQQVFRDTILRGLESDPNVHYVVTPNWANGTDQLLFFFIPPQYQQRVAFGTVDDFMSSRQDLSRNTVLVALPDEYEKARASALFSKVRVRKTLAYPNGQPGFYLVQLTYAPHVDTVFAQMEAERRKPVEGTVTVQGDPAKITYSRIEAGQPSDMFDGDLQSLVRGVEANPFIVDLTFQKPLPMSSLSAVFGHMSVRVHVSLYLNEEDAPLQFDTTQMNPSGEPHIELSFGRSYAVTRVLLEISNLDVPGGSAKIHIREIRFNP